jgi:hypothetical protein
MPELCKIGLTTNLNERLRSLSGSTAAPMPFELFYAAEIRDDLNLLQVERDIHYAFHTERVSPNREFFRMNPDRAKRILKLLEKPDSGIEEEDDDYIAEVNSEQSLKNSSRATFASLKIPTGSILNFTRDTNITCAVYDNLNVDYCGEILSISAAGEKVYRERYGRTARASRGLKDWSFEEERLYDRRLRIESGEL